MVMGKYWSQESGKVYSYLWGKKSPHFGSCHLGRDLEEETQCGGGAGQEFQDEGRSSKAKAGGCRDGTRNLRSNPEMVEGKA